MILRDSSNLEFEEFRIGITAHGEATFLESDDKQHKFAIPFSRDDIEEALSENSPNRLSTDPLSSFGSILFNTISGLLGRELWTRMAEVERSNRRLRLRIHSNLERAQHLPWELLYDPSRGDFMSLSGRLALVRSRPEGFKETPLTPLPRLRVLVVEADPSGNPSIREELNLLHELAKAHPDRIHIDSLTSTTPQSLREQLRSEKYDIFHFTGVGEVLPTRSRRGGAPQGLRLVGAEGLFDRHELGQLLQDANVRLAVLNASHSDWIARSLATFIPAAIGFRENILDRTGLKVSASLYPPLFEGLPLELAVTASRQAVDRDLPGTGEWCKLIAYLQQSDGLVLIEPQRDEQNSWVETSPLQQANREVYKLRKQLEIYQRNLVMLGGRSSTPDLVDLDQTRVLRQKIGELQVKIRNLG